MRFQSAAYTCCLTKMESRRRGARRRHGARCYGVARRSPVWSSSAARVSAGAGGRQMERGRSGSARVWAGLAQGRVRSVPRAGARSVQTPQSERPMQTGAARTGSILRAGDSGGVRLDERTTEQEHYRSLLCCTFTWMICHSEAYAKIAPSGSIRLGIDLYTMDRHILF